MDDLESQLRPFLKAHGYRVRSRTSNRATSEGLTHVINFQMGRFDPPGTNFIPGFRENFYGRFTVNIGVFAPEVAVAIYGDRPRSFVQEVECCIRMRLGHMGGESADRWWDLPADEKTAADLRKRLERDAFPLLAQLQTRDSILNWLSQPKGYAGPARLTCAIICAHRGEKERATELLAAQVRGASPGHAKYVRSLAGRLGLGPIDT
jgi:Domain of unknown function (DUF4304)